jgi:hypothetical protein
MRPEQISDKAKFARFQTQADSEGKPSEEMYGECSEAIY